jgi:hypothetical protein
MLGGHLLREQERPVGVGTVTARLLCLHSSTTMTLKLFYVFIVMIHQASDRTLMSGEGKKAVYKKTENNTFDALCQI